MADDKNTDNSKSQDSGSEGDKGKLFFGKYKTIEEAENGYKELERGFHSKAQEASTYKEIVDKIGEPVRETQHSQVHDNQNQAAQELTQFYSDPLGWKEKVKREAINEATNVISSQQKQANDLAGRVTAWSSKNADVAEHQDLLEVYVKRTDARLSPENRLDLAAGEVRKRLAALRGSKASNSNIDPNTADSETGSFRQEGSQQHKEQDKQPSGETELAAYAQSRNKNRMKRPGTHH